MKEIKNSRILLDSDIIIDHLRGFKYLENLTSNSFGNTSLISTVSITEIYSLLYFNEIERVEKLISTFKAVNIDSVIAKLAGKYRMIFYKSHNLSIPDALIAACAKISNAILVTKNIKHFPMTDIDIIKPY
ncbi:MAG: PIN domain-containing protein [Candidatus Humimicrobiaceae bacterium]